jgi:hypothetical protein
MALFILIVLKFLSPHLGESDAHGFHFVHESKQSVVNLLSKVVPFDDDVEWWKLRMEAVVMPSFQTCNGHSRMALKTMIVRQHASEHIGQVTLSVVKLDLGSVFVVVTAFRKNDSIRRCPKLLAVVQD